MKMALERLEPCAMKVARTVLRRVVTGDSHDLSDSVGLQTPETFAVSCDGNYGEGKDPIDNDGKCT